MTRIVGWNGYPVVDIRSFPEWPGGEGRSIHPAYLRQLPPEKVTYAEDDGPLHG